MTKKLLRTVIREVVSRKKKQNEGTPSPTKDKHTAAGKEPVAVSSTQGNARPGVTLQENVKE